MLARIVFDSIWASVGCRFSVLQTTGIHVLAQVGSGIACSRLILEVSMRRRTGYSGNFRAPTCRRLLVAFIAVAYLLVGFAGEVSCAGESLFTGVLLSVSAAPDEVDNGSKKAPTVDDHCYTCAPITIPVTIQVSVPASAPIGLSFSIYTISIWETRLLDPPPPKALT